MPAAVAIHVGRMLAMRPRLKDRCTGPGSVWSAELGSPVISDEVFWHRTLPMSSLLTNELVWRAACSPQKGLVLGGAFITEGREMMNVAG